MWHVGLGLLVFLLKKLEASTTTKDYTFREPFCDTIFRGGFGIVYQMHALVAVKSTNTKEELNHSNYPKESIWELLPTRPCRITVLTKVDHMYSK